MKKIVPFESIEERLQWAIEAKKEEIVHVNTIIDALEKLKDMYLNHGAISSKDRAFHTQLEIDKWVYKKVSDEEILNGMGRDLVK
jgi:hypothetical protein